jgi:hypothetical protein
VEKLIYNRLQRCFQQKLWPLPTKNPIISTLQKSGGKSLCNILYRCFPQKSPIFSTKKFSNFDMIFYLTFSVGGDTGRVVVEAVQIMVEAALHLDVLLYVPLAEPEPSDSSLVSMLGACAWRRRSRRSRTPPRPSPTTLLHRRQHRR